MSASKRQNNKTPEWDFFKKVEDLEDITLEAMEKVDKTELEIQDTATLAKDSSILAKHLASLMFVVMYRMSSRTRVEETRDIWIKHLKKRGLSNRVIEMIKEIGKLQSGMVDETMSNR
jgi:hypothetical protein